MRYKFKFFLLLIVCAISTPAIGQVTVDQAQFESQCPDLITDDFEDEELRLFFPGVFGEGFQASTTYAGGTLSYFEPDGDEGVGFFFNIDSATLIDAPFELLVDTTFATANDGCLVFDLDAPATQFGFDVLSGAGTTVEFFDADGNLVATEALPASDVVSGNNNGEFEDDAFMFWGFVAPTGTTFSQVKITVDTASVGGEDLGIAFDNVSSGFCPQSVSCFDQIAQVKAELLLLINDTQGPDLYYLECAYSCLCILQDPIFWQDDFDRLSYYGADFFIGGAYTIAWLEASGNPDVEPIIASVLSTLECIVDNEIDYAIANDGHDCYIYYAEAYADVANELYEDLDLPVVSALVYRLAWLNAFYSTY